MQTLAKWRICAVLQKIGKGGISAFSSSKPSAPAKEKVRKHAVCGLFAFCICGEKSCFGDYLVTKVIPIYFGL